MLAKTVCFADHLNERDNFSKRDLILEISELLSLSENPNQPYFVV